MHGLQFDVIPRRRVYFLWGDRRPNFPQESDRQAFGMLVGSFPYLVRSENVILRIKTPILRGPFWKHQRGWIGTKRGAQLLGASLMSAVGPRPYGSETGDQYRAAESHCRGRARMVRRLAQIIWAGEVLR